MDQEYIIEFDDSFEITKRQFQLKFADYVTWCDRIGSTLIYVVANLNADRDCRVHRHLHRE